MGKEDKRLIGYCRVSTQRQFTEGHALERYIQQLRKYGVSEENIFWDIESGATSKRAGYQIVMERLRTGTSNVLVVPCFDRFTRNVLDWEHAAEELQKLGVEVVLLDKGRIDIDTPYGEFTNTVMAAAASLTQKMNKYNSIQGMKYRRAHNKSCATPFGYRLNPEGKVILDDSLFLDTNKTKAQVARELIELYLDNWSLRKTLSTMVSKYNVKIQGRPKKGEVFPLTAVGFKYWLNIPILRGELIYFWKDKDKRQASDYNPPALLSMEEWSEIKYYLSIGSKFRGDTSKHRPILNPLSGLIFCGECGTKMRCCTSINRRNKLRYTYLYCDTRFYSRLGLPECSQRGSHGYHLEDYVQKTIEAIMDRAEELSLVWTQKDVSDSESILQESSEYVELCTRIHKLESLQDPDLVDIIELKRKQLTILKSKLLEETFEYKYDLSKLQRIITQPGFWEETDVSGLKLIFDALVSRVTHLDGVITVTLKTWDRLQGSGV